MAQYETETGSPYQAELIALITREMPKFRRVVQMRISPEYQPLIAPDDVIQDACAAAIKTLTSFHVQGPDSLERWFKVILFRCLATRLTAASAQKRGGSRRKIVSPAAVESSLVGLAAMVLAPDKTPSGKAASSEAVGALHAALAGLEETSRQAIWMHFVEGYTRTELAAKFDKTPAAINSILFRGLNTLRSQMGSGSSFFSDWPSAAPHEKS